jgi:ribosomal protein L15
MDGLKPARCCLRGKRLGRGQSSGKAGTSGREHNGQKSHVQDTLKRSCGFEGQNAFDAVYLSLGSLTCRKEYPRV